MRNKKVSIFIETVAIVLLTISVFYFLYYILPTIVHITPTTYLFLLLLIQMGVITICFWLIYNETKKTSFTYFFERFRFKKITLKTIYRAFLLFLIARILGVFVQLLLEYFSIPINFTEQFELAKSNNVKQDTILLILTFLIVVILGPLNEEILFRGYLLPRQESVLGKYAWVLNGFAFTSSHVLVYSVNTLLILCPFSFLVAYKVQKHKDTSIGLFSHIFSNAGFIIRLFV